MTVGTRDGNPMQVAPRPATPEWLKTFARRLYGGRCVLCQRTRPLEVAHLTDWRPIRDGVLATANDIFVLAPTDAFWIFHQPVNVVLLCPNCHTLYDHDEYSDVTSRDVIAARDRELATARAAIVVRTYLCNGYVGAVGSQQHPNVITRWFPMLDWLKRAYDAEILPPPYRFLISDVEMIDVPTSQIIVNASQDHSLPRWTGTRFAVRGDRVTPETSSASLVASHDDGDGS